jgi:uncharacterized protein
MQSNNARSSKIQEDAGDSDRQVINKSMPEPHSTSEIIFPEKYLHVKKSVLPNAGKGLFTRKQIPKGTRIVEYLGKITTWKEADHKKGTNPYIYYIKRNHVIDARPFKKSKARFANDARGFRKVKGLVNNAAYVEEGLHVFIEAKRDIPVGAEILVDYGKEYWDIMKHNRALSAKKKS